MSIPLVQEATKDAINTSIIAIKRNIERINMLLGLVDSGSPDLSGLATKQELEDAVNSLQPVDEVTSGNMQSVTSNSVAVVNSYSTTEQKTGGVWLDGKPIYKKTFTFGGINANSLVEISTSGLNIDIVIKGEGYGISGAYLPLTYSDRANAGIFSWYWAANKIILFTGTSRAILQGAITLFYTKTTD